MWENKRENRQGEDKWEKRERWVGGKAYILMVRIMQIISDDLLILGPNSPSMHMRDISICIVFNISM